MDFAAWVAGGDAQGCGAAIRLAGIFEHLRVILAIRKSTVLTVFIYETLL